MNPACLFFAFFIALLFGAIRTCVKFVQFPLQEVFSCLQGDRLF
jgi:hypothetical protein